MSGRFGSWGKVIVKGKEYKILEPKEALLHVFKYKNMPREWDIKDMIFIGGQASGKSTAIRYSIKLICSNQDYQKMGISVVWTNDIRIISDKKYKHLFEGNKVIILIVDDAMSKIDSRRSMSNSNVNMTADYNEIRHRLEENYSKNGIIFVFFAIQIKSRLDKSIRENAKVKIITSYTDKRWFHKLFTKKQSELLREATFYGDIGSDFDKRALNLMKFKTGETATIHVPFVSKKELLSFLDSNNIKHTEVNRSLSRNEALQKLVDAVHEEFPSTEDVNKDVIRGYLTLVKEDIENDYAINFTKSDLSTAIDLSIYYESKNPTPKEEKLKDLTIKERIINCFNVKQWTLFDIKTIEEMTEIDGNKIGTTLSQYDIFKRVDRGIYKIKGTEHKEEDLLRFKPKKEVKQLVM